MKKIGITLILFYCSITLASFFVPPGSVTPTELASNAVTTVKILNAAVTPAKRSTAVTGTSSSTSTFSTSSTTYVDVTNATVTITPTGSKPIFVGMMPDPAGTTMGSIAMTAPAAGPLAASFNLIVDSTSVAQYNFTQNGSTGIAGNIDVPCSAIWTIVPSMTNASHTIKLQTKVVGTVVSFVTNCVLIAYEM